MASTPSGTAARDWHGMIAVSELCERPESEKPYVLVVAGYPAEGCVVSRHGGLRNGLSAIADWR